MHTTSAERVIGFALPSVYCQYAMYDLHSVFHKNRKPVDEIKIQASKQSEPVREVMVNQRIEVRMLVHPSTEYDMVRCNTNNREQTNSIKEDIQAIVCTSG